jgi:hypothetical protein
MENIKSVEVGYSTSEIKEIDNVSALELIHDGGAVPLAGTRDEVIDVVEHAPFPVVTPFYPIRRLVSRMPLAEVFWPLYLRETRP